MAFIFTDLAEFGEIVRRRRTEEGLSQEELGSAVGISRVYLSQIERGLATNLSNTIAEKLVKYLGIVPNSNKPPSESSNDWPAGLKDFQAEFKVSHADVAMLATLQFRGKKPKTSEQWHQLYSIIKATSISWE